MTRLLPKGDGRRSAVQRLSNMGKGMSFGWQGAGGKKKSGLFDGNSGIVVTCSFSTIIKKWSFIGFHAMRVMNEDRPSRPLHDWPFASPYGTLMPPTQTSERGGKWRKPFWFNASCLLERERGGPGAVDDFTRGKCLLKLNWVAWNLFAKFVGPMLSWTYIYSFVSLMSDPFYYKHHN